MLNVSIVAPCAFTLLGYKVCHKSGGLNLHKNPTERRIAAEFVDLAVVGKIVNADACMLLSNTKLHPRSVMAKPVR